MIRIHLNDLRSASYGFDSSNEYIADIVIPINRTTSHLWRDSVMPVISKQIEDK